MMLFKSISAALLVAGASAQSLRKDMSHRQLSFEGIAGYVPGSQVTDHNALDLDLASMITHLAAGTTQSFGIAQAIYEKGAHSKSYARITLTPALSSTLAQGTKIEGKSADGNDVVGKAYAEVPSGNTEIRVQYKTSDIQSSYVTCQVGALVTPNLEGCLAPNGTVTIGSDTFEYEYDPRTQNENGRTIQGFSLQAREKMNNYEDYKKFVAYYGQFDYANQLILAAFGGSATSFDNGNANFAQYSDVGKSEVIKKACAYMAVYMYVIREFEDALDDCKDTCIFCNDDPVHAWDEGVAFYTGSLEGQDGAGDGVMMYALADKRCVDFGTCGFEGKGSEGTSKVNYDIFGQFALGQQNLIQGNCDAARVQKNRVANIMKVPLVQGTIRYAYITGEQVFSEKAEAEGAVFAASVLPYVHACSESDARIIHENMAVGSGPADFRAVKQAFERNYKCMGISCGDVGSYNNPATNKPYEGASACTFRVANANGENDGNTSGGGGSNTVGIALGVTAGIIAVLAIGVVFFMRRREIQGKPVFAGGEAKESGVST